MSVVVSLELEPINILDSCRVISNRSEYKVYLFPHRKKPGVTGFVESGAIFLIWALFRWSECKSYWLEYLTNTCVGVWVNIWVWKYFLCQCVCVCTSVYRCVGGLQEVPFESRHFSLSGFWNRRQETKRVWAQVEADLFTGQQESC